MIADHFRPEVRGRLRAYLGLRFALSTADRMMFPFLPALSRGTGLSLEELGRVLFVRDLTGLAATVFGRRVDVIGTARAVVLGGVALAVGLLLASLGTVGVVVGLVLFGLGRLAVNISLNAWIGDEVAYERRGRASGLFELTWSASFLIGVPICGVLIDQLGWRSAFVATSAATALFVALSAREGFEDKRISTDTPEASRPLQPAGAFVWGRNAVATVGGPILLIASAQFLFFGHGTWLEETYGFTATNIGLVVIGIAVGEGLASYASARLADAMGKRNAVIAGVVLMVVAMLPMLLSSPALWLGLVSMVLTFSGFEFGIVSSVALVAELSENERGRVFGWSVGGRTLARALVALGAGWLDQRYAFSVLVWCALGFGIAAIALTALATEPT